MNDVNYNPNGTPNVPNLDCMESDDLYIYVSQFEHSDDKQRALTASYAYSKAKAQDSRLAGNILHAQAREDACDAIYDKLPSDYRW